MDSYLNCIIRKRNLLAHVTIWTIAAIVLAISLSVFKGNLLGIIYLLFFTSFVLTFQTSYSLWARSIKLYCILLTSYSIFISILTYFFQFDFLSQFLRQHLSDSTLNDIGLVTRDKGWMLFLEPLLPLTLGLSIIVYLKGFHDNFNRFVYLAEELDSSLSTPLTDNQFGLGHSTINDATFIMMSTNSVSSNNQDEPEQANRNSIETNLHENTNQQLSRMSSGLSVHSVEPTKTDIRRMPGHMKVRKFFDDFKECFLRILEIHLIKLVAFMIFRLSVIDVCLMNSPFLIIVILSLRYPSAARCCCLAASWFISIIIIVRNLSNLTSIKNLDITDTCPGLSPPAGTYSVLEYIGVRSSNPISTMNRVDNHIIVLVLITFYSFVCIHYKRRNADNCELTFGVIFSGIGRREADKSILNTIKYFCNFGFHKFGIEISCLALIIAISNRLDAVAAVYAILLMILSISTSKRMLSKIWPFFNLLVGLLIPIQYALRLGLPKALCEPYPWDGIPSDFKHWFFLPDYQVAQNSALLLYDFLVLLALARQSVVFRNIRVSSAEPIVTSNPVHQDLSAKQFRARYLPNAQEFRPEDCFSSYTTQSSYLRSIFFISIYWITLTVVLVTGATNVSLFSLGYLIGCFIFLWLGNDAYLMRLPRLIFSWNWFIFYATLVMLVKVFLQLYTCYKHEELVQSCFLLKLLRVVCYRKMMNVPQDASNTCLPPFDDLDILWDGLCLVFLLMQRVVFGSQYFRYLVQEVKAQQILASRGAELIMATQIEEAKAQDLYEKEVMMTIREKMENLKSDNEETSRVWQRILALPHHHQIIRNAGKHLFSLNHDDPVSQCRTDNWKIRKAFIPDPLGDELERMAEINGISAVFTRWMKGDPLYGNVASPPQTTNPPSSVHQGENSDLESVSEGQTSPRSEIKLERDPAPDTSITQPSHQPIHTQAIRPPLQPSRPPKTVDPYDSFEEISDNEIGSSGRVRGCWDMFNLIMYSILLSMTVQLNKLSRSYRYVSRRLTIEKNILKKEFQLDDERFKKDPAWRKWVIGTLSETYFKTIDEQNRTTQSNTSLHRIRSALKVITSTASQDTPGPQSSGDSEHSPPSNTSPGHSRQQQRSELTDPEYYFLKLNILTHFCRALTYVVISNTSLLCQLVIIFNQVITASLLSLPLPLLTFLWGTLSVPRPTKRFWKTVITYTELVIVVKYVCRFPIWKWDQNNINPFYYPNLLGIKDITIVNDYLLLLALFFHRSMLKSLGQWDASGDRGSSIVAENNPFKGDTSPKDAPSNHSVTSKAIGESRRNSAENDDNRSTNSQPARSNSEQPIGLDIKLNNSLELERIKNQEHYLEDSYQTREAKSNDLTGISAQETNGEGEQQQVGRCYSCWSPAYNRVHRSITLFFQHVLNTPYKVQTDVYTWMFLCDFINFLILIYGFWAFGSGYTNQTLASFLNENRIPFSVLIMLLLQFASIIVDRSLYLQKKIAGKLMFQVILVIGIHFWIFFLLPFTTGHTLTLRDYWPPKAWYVIKCLYFLLSAHQIRCGYPRRVLGNCFTKRFGYFNWITFKIYRALPLVYDLRLYMDWIWTSTTLEFRNWSIMEDMFANLFIRKCELEIEEEFPQPRAKPIRRWSKYLTGGAFILLILAIVWGPLLLFSMGKTVGESNPPVEMEYELEFVGYQPILRMRATGQQIFELNEELYNKIKLEFNSLSSQSFLGDYKVGDVSAIRLDGQSNAVWEISPPSKASLMERIKNNQSLSLKSSWTLVRIKRQKSQNFDVSIAGSYQKEIDENSTVFRNALYDMLNDSSTTMDSPTNIKYVITPPIFPNYIRVPETGLVSLVDQFMDSVPNTIVSNPLRPLRISYIRMFDNTTKKPDGLNSWWKAEDLCKFNPNFDSYQFWSPEVLEHCNSLLVVAFNDRIFTGILALLSAPGIIGLYTTFVVFFARLIRTEPSGRVIYTEIPQVDRVYGLILDIYMMRECGEFELEEKLFAKLLFLYRSPEMLIEWSRREDLVYDPSQAQA